MFCIIFFIISLRCTAIVLHSLEFLATWLLGAISHAKPYPILAARQGATVLRDNLLSRDMA